MTDNRPDDPPASETESEEPNVDKSTIEDLDVPDKDAEGVEGGMLPPTICTKTWSSTC